MRKNSVAVVVVGCSWLFPLVVRGEDTVNKTVEFTILHVNDVYEIERPEDQTLGGLSRVADGVSSSSRTPARLRFSPATPSARHRSAAPLLTVRSWRADRWFLSSTRSGSISRRSVTMNST